MATLEEIIPFLDGELRTTEVPDYPNALNGLQLRNRSGQIHRVIAAVDASLPVVRDAAAHGTDGGSLLLVHHGLFWQGLQPHTGAAFEKLRIALEAELAIYSSHIPLDIHPRLGNNARLADAIGLQDAQPFFTWKGIELGLAGSFPGSRDALRETLTRAVGSPVHLCPGGGEQAGRVGIITGGAGSEIAAMAAEAIDTFITGEGPHWSFPLAEELGINVLYAGHYATETFGVRALAAELAGRFQLECHFVDRPTGL
jgi:dinuclear metal center YbgI/SA1388 family protein